MSNAGDREILNAVLNPSLPVGEGLYDEANLAPEQLRDDDDDDDHSEMARMSKSYEKCGVAAAERGELPAALKLLSQAIEAAPNRASCFNNRAQALRLRGNTEQARQDLDAALELSGGRGRSACQAFCQRALINRKDGLDEDAIKDFQAAAQLGSRFAKSFLVQLNPYAAMCNKMLKSVFEALEEGKEMPENPFKNVTGGGHKG